MLLYIAAYSLELTKLLITKEISMFSEQLKMVGVSETAKTIANMWAERRRISHKIDVDRLRTNMVSAGMKVVPEEFMQYFKDLEEQEVGYIVHGRSKNPTTFYPYYSLKDIGKSVINPNSHIELKKLERDMIMVKRSRGRHKGTKNRRTHILKTISPEKAILFITSIDGSVVPVSLEEAEKVTSQIAIIKSKLNVEL